MAGLKNVCDMGTQTDVELHVMVQEEGETKTLVLNARKKGPPPAKRMKVSDSDETVEKNDIDRDEDGEDEKPPRTCMYSPCCGDDYQVGNPEMQRVINPRRVPHERCRAGK